MIDATIFCGSRALAEIPGGEAWARGVLRARLFDMGPGGIVIHGNCRGSPDVWSAEVAAEHAPHMRVEAYDDSGLLLVKLANGAGFSRGHWREKGLRRAVTWADFRERNEAMVARGLELRARGLRVRCLCLAAEATRTRGAIWTADRAAHAGLESRTFYWKPTTGDDGR